MQIGNGLLGKVLGLFLTALPAVAMGQSVQVMSPPYQSAGTPQIVDGYIQREDAWPATLRFLVDGQFYCTSTIVGSRTIITAAHCLVPGAKMQIELEPGNSINLKCELHPAYRRFDLYSDVAMCFSEKDLPTFRQVSENRLDFQYENLDLKITRVNRGDKLFLLGYGCRAYPRDAAARSDASSAPSGGADSASAASGVLYGGLAPIESIPSQPGEHVRTAGTTGICPGDSGGAAYVLSDPSALTGPRSIIAVNSGYRPDGKISDLTALYGVEKFIRDWAEDHDAKICGIHHDASNCRDKFVP